MSLFGKTKLFTGRHTGKLDDKNRLTIPAAWRFEAEGDAAYLATYYPASGTILVFPPEMVQQIAAASSKVSLSDPDKQEAMSTLGENSITVSCDKSGRIILSEVMLRQAGILKDVVFKGAFKTFQISAPEPPPADTTSPAAQRMLHALRELGL